MTEHPIIMSAESVRAIQAGLKHETRRPVKPQPWQNQHGTWVWEPKGFPDSWLASSADQLARMMLSPKPPVCPYGQPGDKLRVKETWCSPRYDKYRDVDGPIYYKASDEMCANLGRWHSPLFMPRWASRFILSLVEVRSERLQDITYDGIVAEGVDVSAIDSRIAPDSPVRPLRELALNAFIGRWNKLNAKRGFPWASNPWVWVLRWA